MRILLIVLLLFVGLSAIWAGTLLAWMPDGSSMGMPLIWLQHSPFFDYRIPGILLLTVVGFGSLVAAAVVLFRGAHGGRFAQVAGIALVIWIIVQMIMLRTMLPIQFVFLFVGTAIAWLGERLHRA